MIERLERVDPDATADEFTEEYVEMTVWEALDSLRSPGAGEFFGRIDEPRRGGGVDQWYIGRRHIENDDHDPVVVDWRAPISAPFYRATAVDPLGMSFRRRFTLDEGEMIAYLDEHLDDPSGGEVASGVPDPVLAEIGAARSGRDARDRRDDPGRAGHRDPVADRPGADRAGRSRAPARRRSPCTARRTCCSSTAAGWRATACWSSGRTGRSSTTSPTSCHRSASAAVRQCTALDLCMPKVEIGGVDDPPTARWKGSADRLDDLVDLALAAIVPPDGDVAVPIGARTVRVHAGRGGDVDRHRQAGDRADQPAARTTPRARSPGDPPPHGLRRGVVAAAPLKAVLNKAWPTQQPVRLVDRMLPGSSGKRRIWTAADQFLVDEANTLLNGTPFTYGHVIVDEAQDHSAVALRVIGRRSPSGSMTLVGDVAQSTTPAGQENWRDVFANLAVRGSCVDRFAARSAVP